MNFVLCTQQCENTDGLISPAPPTYTKHMTTKNDDGGKTTNREPKEGIELPNKVYSIAQNKEFSHSINSFPTLVWIVFNHKTE